MGDFCGVLAICVDPVNKGWIIFLRREKIKTIAWSGDNRHSSRENSAAGLVRNLEGNRPRQGRALDRR